MMDIDEIQNELVVALVDFAAGDAKIMAALRARAEQAEAALQDWTDLDEWRAQYDIAQRRACEAEAEVAALRAQIGHEMPSLPCVHCGNTGTITDLASGSVMPAVSRQARTERDAGRHEMMDDMDMAVGTLSEQGRREAMETLERYRVDAMLKRAQQAEAERDAAREVLKQAREALRFAVIEIELGAPYEFSEEWWYRIDKQYGNASAWNYKRFCDALAAIDAILEPEQ